ncbi:MAG: SMP-30/gluconolactonase/LRE family protein [Myxococcales bacterium]|nr:SMP-30/gluconolactonase/LRE family protein [Myxococcales bacterium]
MRDWTRTVVAAACLAGALVGCDDQAFEPDAGPATADGGSVDLTAGDGGGRPVFDAAALDGAPDRDRGGVDAQGQDAAADAQPVDQGGPGDAAVDLGSDAAVTPEPDAMVDPGPRRFQDEYPIAARHTEGGIYDPVDHAFYVGSLTTGGVYRIDAQTGAERPLFLPPDPGVWWTLGMAVDVVSHQLWVCAMDDRREHDEAADYVGYLWGFDLDTGERVVNQDLRRARDRATCTDVAVADDGTVYVNDRQNPRLYRYEPARGRISQLVEDDALAGAVVGQNALLVVPDQSALLSLVYLPSRLVHVSLPDAVVTEVEIQGDFSDLLPPLSGADGMALEANGGVLVAFTSQLNRLRFVNGYTRAIASTVDIEGGGLTDVVHTLGGNYLLNGQAVDFALGNDPDPSRLVRFDDDL